MLVLPRNSIIRVLLWAGGFVVFPFSSVSVYHQDHFLSRRAFCFLWPLEIPNKFRPRPNSGKKTRPFHNRRSIGAWRFQVPAPSQITKTKNPAMEFPPRGFKLNKFPGSDFAKQSQRAQQIFAISPVAFFPQGGSIGPTM